MAGKPRIPEAENEKIAARYRAGEGAEALAVEYGVERNAIYRVLAKTGTPRDHKGGSDPTDPTVTAAIVEMYQKKIGSTTIAREFGISKKTVFNVLVRAGVGTRPQNNRTGDEYHISEAQQRNIDRERPGHARGPIKAIDEHVFDVITPAAAYWIGYLITDGCVHESVVGRSDKLALRQSRTHRGHAEKFRRFLKSDHAISDGTHWSFGKMREHSVFQATAPHLCAILKRYGVRARKTGTASAPPELRNDPNFWRGVIDGDGTVYSSCVACSSSSPRIAAQFRRFVRHISGSAVRCRAHYLRPNNVWRTCLRLKSEGACVVDAMLREATPDTLLAEKWARYMHLSEAARSLVVQR